MKKKIFFSILILILSLAFFRCTVEPPPHVTDVQYNSLNGRIDITLSGNNYLPTNEIETRITLSEDSFNGTSIDFNVNESDITQYYLDSFDPALKSGHDYYITFEEGAFGNYEDWTGWGDSGESLPGSYVVSVP